MLPLRTYDYRAFDAPFRAAIPPGAVVLAEPTYWLALRDHPYVNIWDLSWMWQRDGLATPEAIRRIRPDAIIVDPGVRGFFVQATPQTGLMASPFWRPVVEPLLFPSPLSGTLQDALGQDYRLAYSQWFDEHGQVDVYLRIQGR